MAATVDPRGLMADGTPVTHVWDGYVWYELLADTGDGWLTVRVAGHVHRILKREVRPTSPTGFPGRW